MRRAFEVSVLVTIVSIGTGACEAASVTDTTAGEAPDSRSLTAFAPGTKRIDFRPTREQLDEARKRLITSLPVGRLGRIDLVDAGLGGTPWIVQFSVGGRGVHEVLDQLVKQDATPAEVFLAVAPRDSSLPDVLLRDHRERLARGETKFDAPRRLQFDAPSVEEVEWDCWSGGEADEPWPFNAWVEDFIDWAKSYIASSTFRKYDTSAEFPKYGWIPAQARRAMSVCDASHNTASDPSVTFAGLGYHFPYTIVPTYFYVAEALDEFESVRFRSTDGPFSSYFILIDQDYPDPRRAYVAYGSCDGCIF